MSNGMESTAPFLLSFPVENHIYFVTLLAHKSTSRRILYVTIRACAEHYTAVNNLTGVETISDTLPHPY